MAAEIEFEPFLARLYEAALEPALWPAAWAEATAATGTAAPPLVLVADNEGPAPLAMRGWDRHAASPAVAAVPEVALTASVPVVAASNAVPLNAVLPIDASPAASRPAASLSMIPRTRRALAVSNGSAQPVDQPAPDCPILAQERMSAAHVHLQRAVRMRARLAIARTVFAASAAALQAADIGMVLVTVGGRTIHSNPTARSLAGMVGLQLDSFRGGLQTPDSIATAHLHSLIHDAAAGGAGGDMLMRASDGSAVALAVCALPQMEDQDALLEQEPGQACEQVGLHVMVTLRRLARTVACPQRVAALFGLTQSEADVAVAIATGHPAATVAARRGVTVKAVQAQLRAALSKAGVPSLQELTMLLARLG